MRSRARRLAARVKGYVVHGPERLRDHVQRQVLPPLRVPIYRFLDMLSTPTVDGLSCPQFSVYGVYRARNAEVVSQIIGGADSHARHLWHCLDGPQPPVLERYTTSSGPGSRITLLQDLISRFPPRPGEWMVICDDDIEFTRGDLAGVVAVSAAAGFDISQPAHMPLSTHSFSVNRQRPISIAQRSAYVEVGPLVIFSPRAQERVLPFPAEAGMGWGLDVTWSTLDGLVMGIVDQTLIRHLGEVGASYGRREELDRLNAALLQAGLTSVEDINARRGRPWRPWQVRAPWRQEQRP